MQNRLRCVQIGCRVGKSAVDCSRQTTNRADCRQGEQHQKQCVLSQILTFFFLPQSCEKTLHVRSLPGTSTYMSRTMKVSGPLGHLPAALDPSGSLLDIVYDWSNYVVFFKAAFAFAKVPLIAVARPPIEPIAARESRTRSNAYSVRSWPSSSFHNLARRRFIFVPP